MDKKRFLLFEKCVSISGFFMHNNVGNSLSAPKATKNLKIGLFLRVFRTSIRVSLFFFLIINIAP